MSYGHNFVGHTDLRAGKGEEGGPSSSVPQSSTVASTHPLLTMSRRASRLPW